MYIQKLAEIAAKKEKALAVYKIAAVEFKSLMNHPSPKDRDI